MGKKNNESAQLELPQEAYARIDVLNQLDGTMPDFRRQRERFTRTLRGMRSHRTRRVRMGLEAIPPADEQGETEAGQVDEAALFAMIAQKSGCREQQKRAFRTFQRMESAQDSGSDDSDE